LEHELAFMMYCPIVYVSAQTGFNIRGSVDKIGEVGQALRTTIATGALNRTIVAACARVSPPTTQGRRLKIFYGTQTGHCPLNIRLFVNDPKLLTSAYHTYLVRSLRDDFSLAGLPIVFRAQARRPKRGEPGNKSNPSSTKEIFEEEPDFSSDQ
jgi:GTP-binding protein